ncbi:MAG: 30S ribosome-binding factor RbfA [Proteobacteria bacterium]|nr:30S ribosome-binding factor RbfA [Pseudomonadota bacterium]
MKAGTSTRQQRVEGLIKEIVSQALARGDTHHPLLTSLITISAVEVSPDLRHAKVYFSPLGGRGDIKELATALNDEARYFSAVLGRQMHTKYTPRLRFVYDDAFDEASRMDDLIRRANSKPIGVDEEE